MLAPMPRSMYESVAGTWRPIGSSPSAIARVAM